MNKRQFLKVGALAAVGLAVAPVVMAKIPTKYQLTEADYAGMRAMDKMHRRMTLDMIKKEVEDSAKYFIFEPSDEVTREKLRMELERILRTYHTSGFIVGFDIEVMPPKDNMIFGQISIGFYIYSEVETTILDFNIVPLTDEIA